MCVSTLTFFEWLQCTLNFPAVGLLCKLMEHYILICLELYLVLSVLESYFNSSIALFDSAAPCAASVSECMFLSVVVPQHTQINIHIILLENS